VQPSQAGGLPLAEPLDVRHVGLDATLGEGRPRIELFTSVPGGDAVVPYLLSPKRTYRYSQIVDVQSESNRQPAIQFDPAYREYLTTQPVPEEIGGWARERLLHLPGLSAEARTLDADGKVPPEHHSAVSEAFCRYFGHSPEFSYTLKLRRHDRKIDATADFLLNVKQGHCERFAGALALSLRSLGMPARAIKGYRGAEEESAGEYVIRLDQAHSWVQVLVQEGERWYWLTLDPTPGRDEENNPLSNWLDWLTSMDLRELWQRFVLNYNRDSQSSMVYYLWQGIWQNAIARHILWQLPAGFAAAAALIFTWRRRGSLAALLHRYAGLSPLGATSAGLYTQLLHVLARHAALRPLAGQTPLEFAKTARSSLEHDRATKAWAQLPTDIVRAHYRVRFADVPLSPAEEHALAREVAGLAAALQASKSLRAPRA